MRFRVGVAAGLPLQLPRNARAVVDGGVETERQWVRVRVGSRVWGSTEPQLNAAQTRIHSAQTPVCVYACKCVCVCVCVCVTHTTHQKHTCHANTRKNALSLFLFLTCTHTSRYRHKMSPPRTSEFLRGHGRGSE